MGSYLTEDQSDAAQSKAPSVMARNRRDSAFCRRSHENAPRAEPHDTPAGVPGGPPPGGTAYESMRSWQALWAGR